MKKDEIIKVKNSDIIGKIITIDYLNESLKIKIIKGNTPITDYYFNDVEILKEAE